MTAQPPAFGGDHILVSTGRARLAHEVEIINGDAETIRSLYDRFQQTLHTQVEQDIISQWSNVCLLIPSPLRMGEHRAAKIPPLDWGARLRALNRGITHNNLPGFRPQDQRIL